MSAFVTSWRLAYAKGRIVAAPSWTVRFLAGSALALLYMLIQLDWLGLVPGTALSVFVQGVWLGLVGWYALRVGAAGVSCGLFVGTFGVFFDQTTLAIGVAQLPSGLPDDYWFANTLRVAAVLALYPWLVRWIGLRLRGFFALVAVPLALAPLPFLRLFDAPQVVLESVVGGVGGIILPVPWPAVVLGASVVAISIDLGGALPRVRADTRTVVITALIVTLGLPGWGAARDAYLRATSVLVTSTSSGPLDRIQLQAATPDTSSATATWDGIDAIGSDGGPVRALSRRGIATASIIPALQPGLRGGEHSVGLRIGDSVHVSSYRLPPPGGIELSDSDGYVTVRGGRAGHQLQLLVLGTSGPEQLSVQFDQKGVWRSSARIPATVRSLVGQSDDSWNMLVVER
jgi:hypothetical protein